MRLTIPLATIARPAGIVMIVVLGPLQGAAAVLYWDTNGATAGLGSATSPVAWLTNSWATGSTGVLPTGAWPNVALNNSDLAEFSGNAGTVSVAADVYANAIRFRSTGYLVESTGGALRLSGPAPSLIVAVSPGGSTATISAPIVSADGFSVDGIGEGGLDFLVLANADAANPNAFGGIVTITSGGALRLGGGAAREQIPDDVDLYVLGVVDFITSGGVSDGKQERVRDVTANGASVNFSVGNGSDFIVNSMTAEFTGAAPGIAVNGNSAGVPGKLSITGWSDGAGHLTLRDARVRVNTTSAQSAIGGRVLLAGNIYSRGASEVSNNNGGATPDDNTFTHKALDFTSAAHEINVADGTLTFTSRSAAHPLDITSTHAGGTTLTKTGAGVWLIEHAAFTSFNGVYRVEEGTQRLGASERLADAAQLEIAGGVFDLQTFTETVATLLLNDGAINGGAAATLASSDFEVRSGTVNVRLAGPLTRLRKTTAGAVTLNGMNTYSQATVVSEGTLLVNGTHSGLGGYLVSAGGTLGGGGAISADATVRGTLAPGASVGTFTAGDVRFDAGSHFAVEAQGAATDKLVAAALTIDEGAILDLSALGPVVAGNYVIAEYTSLAGAFGNVNAPAGYSVSYATPGQIILNVPAIPGDFDHNGAVNGLDLAAWQSSYGAAGSDADHDGDSDGHDFLVWQRHNGLPAIAPAVAVPEPCTLAALATLCAAVLTTSRWRPAAIDSRTKGTA